MSKHGDEDDLIARLVRAFQDAHLERSDYGGIPYIPNETAQSHFFRIIDFMNQELWADTSANAISKEVILALLQCAARLYEGGVHAKEAIDLIESEDTRAILSLGIQDNLSQVIHQRCVESIISNRSKATNAENCSQQAGLFSAIRKNKARQLNHQAMIIEHISSLCHLHSTTLQNTFDGPMVNEQFMFTNYIRLSETLNLYEKSWLVTLLPDIFQWENQDSCGDVKLLSDGFLAASLAIVPSALEEANQDPVIINDDLQGRITLSTYRDIQEAFSFMDSSIPPLIITDRDVQHWLGKSTPEENNEMWRICCNWRNQHQHSGPELSTPTSMFLKFERWMELLRKRAVTYRNLASVEAVTSVLNGANGLHDQATCQKEESTPFSKKIEREDVRDYVKALKDGLVSPSDDISDLDLNHPESDDDSECIFPLSPVAPNNASNGKPVSTPPLHDTDMLGKDLHGRITSVKDIQSTFTIAGSSNPSLKIAGKDCDYWSKRFEPCDQSKDHENEKGLWTIPEEPQEQ
jgi:hypothetical protein